MLGKHPLEVAQSLPVRGAWIEILIVPQIAAKYQSLPVRGAWIEIRLHDFANRPIRSLPVRGAWIEIPTVSRTRRRHQSLPVRGAWIEMLVVVVDVPVRECRSPCGERGLKLIISRLCDLRKPSLPVRGAWIEIPCRLPSDSGLPVAPRAGSVD